MDIQAVMRRHEDALMKLPNVVGVGIGERHGEQAIKVLVTRKVAESSLSPEQVVPRQLEGYQTDVEEIGTVTAQPQ